MMASKSAATYGFYAVLILSWIDPSHGYCPRGWIRHGGKCFGAFMPKSYHTSGKYMSRKVCAVYGGTLLKSDDEEKNRAAAKLLHFRTPLHIVRALIGLNDRDNEGIFRWGDGTNVTDTWQNWASAKPRNNRFEDCVEISEKGKWKVTSCKNILRSRITLCEQQIKDTCPSGWIRHAGKCYAAFAATSFKKTVEDLEKEHCIENNGVLMSIKTEQENRIDVKLIHLFLSINMAQGIIGLGDRAYEGSYRWSDGTKLTWENWLKGQPNNGTGEECVELRADGKWNGIPCKGNHLKGYITLCEQPITASGNCPVDWVKYGSKCYAGFQPNRTPLIDNVNDMEKVHCIANNGILMNPKTEEGNNFALDLVKSLNANGTYNGVISKPKRNKWQNWAEGEPEEGEDCFEMYPSGKWGSCPCVDLGYTHIALCEKKETMVASTEIEASTATMSGTSPPTISGTSTSTMSGAPAPTISGTSPPTISGTSPPTTSGTSTSTLSGAPESKEPGASPGVSTTKVRGRCRKQCVFVGVKAVAGIRRPRLMATPDDEQKANELEECLRVCKEHEKCALVNYNPSGHCAIYWDVARAQSLGAERSEDWTVWIYQERYG